MVGIICVLAWDTTQSTASDRVKIYVNGVYRISSSGSSGVMIFTKP